MSMTPSARTFVLAACLLGAGCNHTFDARTPDGFVELPDQTAYEYRATSADGLVVAVREIDHDPQGSLAFWKRVVENSMRQRGGYAVLGERKIETASGLAGVQLRFGHDEGKTPHVYLVSIVPTSSMLYLVEAGGTKEQVDAHQKELDEAVLGLRPKSCFVFEGFLCATVGP